MGKSPVLLSFGHGYTARALARRLLTKGWRVIGTTRSETRAEAIRASGAEAVIWPMFKAGPLLDLATNILVSAGPEAGDDPVLMHCAGALGARTDQFGWIGYLSTTGVYGDRAGGWVDEDSALEPTSPRAMHRVGAERAWLKLRRSRGLPVHIFRLAGIYGPGRSALGQARAGAAKRIHKPGQAFSRIHVDDIATVLEASIARPHPGRAYNLCDDDPASPAEVVAQACALLGLEPPPLVHFEAAALSAMARSFYRDNKRVSNQRIKEELGVSLAYPDFKAGLEAILAAGG